MATTAAPDSKRSFVHGNAKLTPAGRRVLVGRIAAGRPVAH
ncbi:MAG: IS481 family transposase, partial [Chloroflexi bacterium]